MIRSVPVVAGAARIVTGEVVSTAIEKDAPPPGAWARASIAPGAEPWPSGARDTGMGSESTVQHSRLQPAAPRAASARAAGQSRTLGATRAAELARAMPSLLFFFELLLHALEERVESVLGDDLVELGAVVLEHALLVGEDVVDDPLAFLAEQLVLERDVDLL